MKNRTTKIKFDILNRVPIYSPNDRSRWTIFSHPHISTPIELFSYFEFIAVESGM